MVNPLSHRFRSYDVKTNTCHIFIE